MIEWSSVIGEQYLAPTITTIVGAAIIYSLNKVYKVVIAKVSKEKESEIGESFRRVIECLASKDLEVKMSAAISLRRFFDPKSEVGLAHTPYAKQAIDVMSSLLKVTKTSEYQKILADGIRFVPNKHLDRGDFQRANLSKAFLSSEDCQKSFRGADFFQANLSGALLKYAELNEAVFYEATLTGTKFQHASLKSANFQQASLLDVSLNNSNLNGANFYKSTLINVDLSNADLTKAKFDEATLINVKFPSNDKMEGTTFNRAVGSGDNLPKGIDSIANNCEQKKIFISKPGILDIRQERYVARIKEFIEVNNYAVVILDRDTYEQAQVLSKLTKLIDECFAVVVFGFSSTYIKEGVFRDNTEDCEMLENVFLATPWCQVEVGIASAKNRQILLLSEDGITEGVFDESVNESTITRLRMDACLSVNKSNISNWFNNIKK